MAPFSTQCSKILALLESGKKLNALVTFDNLKKYGFIPTLAGHPDSPQQGKTKKHKRKQVISDSEDEGNVLRIIGAPISFFDASNCLPHAHSFNVNFTS